MIFFLNLDGTMTREDTGRIFQGSTAVPDIKVLSVVSSATGGLSVAFTLPSGLTTLYYPLAIVGEHTFDNGFKTYVWGIKQETLDEHGINEKVTSLIGNVTQEVGKVGVTIRQTNAVTGADVASYTANFTVEYSALPTPPSTMQVSEISTLLSLLNAYYSQNADDIRTLKERVGVLEQNQIETIDFRGNSRSIEAIDEGGIMVSIDDVPIHYSKEREDREIDTVVQYLPLVAGNGIAFENKGEVVEVKSTFPSRQPNTDGSCYVLAPNGINPAFEQLTVVKTSNLTYDVRVGGKTAGTITIPQDTYLDAVAYNPETKELKFTYNTSSGKEEIVIPLSDLEDVNNLLIATSQSELNSLLVSANVGKAISYNGDLYVVAREDNSIIAKEIANIADVNLIDTWLDTDFEDVDYDDKVGISWSSHYELSNGEKVYGQGDIAQCVPIVAGKNASIKVEGKTFKINADSATQIYETAVEGGGDETPEEISPSDLFPFRVARMYEGQRYPEVGDLIIYKSNVPNSKGQNPILCKITQLEERAEDEDEPFGYGTPICFIQGASGTEALAGATINLASMPAENITITDTGIYTYIPEVELELADGRLVYMQSRNTIPLVAGEGVEFKKNENNTVSINATGGGGGGGDISSFYIGDAIEELEIDTNGKGINVTYQDAEIEMNGGESYNYIPVNITIPIVAGENVTLAKDETNNVVKIDIPTAGGELVDDLAYSDLVGVPILIADLDTITPTANTYYKHNGADETTYTKGVIYFYDGTAFKAITGGGAGAGINDVKVNGTSVVADGVANIPAASKTQAGVVTTGAQTFNGEKTFDDDIWLGTSAALYASSGAVTIKTKSSYNGASFLFANNNAKWVRLYCGALATDRLGVGLKNSRSEQYILADTTASGTLESILPTYSGTLMSAPSTWSTGTSGSAKLPSAGLYEVKFTIYGSVRSAILNWDGTNYSEASVFLDEMQNPNSFIVLYADPYGTLEVEETQLGSGGGPASVSISYRKIGIA